MKTCQIMLKQPVAMLAASALATGCASTGFVDRPAAREGIAAAEPVLAALANYQSTNGKFPLSFADLSLPTSVMSRIDDVGLRYLPLRDQGSYVVAFNFPAGMGLMNVHCAQSGSSNNGRWQCLGK